ncbi:restriction endonuclease subunit S [Jeotgalibaca caeni]|uniref:restriction endonuclease subunit S n=1 Tax=Jeotgalibaca caeni TaxID=3028623 RepID=UPI003B82ECC9
MTVTSVKRIHQSDWTNSGIRFLRARDIVSASKNEEPTDYLYISEEKYNEYSLISGKVSRGDLLVTGVGSIGVPMLITNDNPVYFKDGNIIWFKNNNTIDGDFFYYSFVHHKTQKYIQDVAGIGTVGTYTIDSGKKTPISLPETKEQNKIGNFFKQLDNTIALHQRKLEALKQLKNGLLQKIFLTDKQKVPQIRFAGFEKEWEKCKLENVAHIVGGGTPSTSNENFWNGDIDWYSPAEIGEQRYLYESKKKITSLGLQKSSAKLLPIGTVLFTSRAGIGNTAILSKEAATNQGFQSIVPRSGQLDSYFIFSNTNSLKRYGNKTGAGSTFVEVSGKQMGEMPLLIPSFNEQAKIGVFFKLLDDTIALYQNQLNQLHSLKSTFLQKMFV